MAPKARSGLGAIVLSILLAAFVIGASAAEVGAVNGATAAAAAPTATPAAQAAANPAAAPVAAAAPISKPAETLHPAAGDGAVLPKAPLMQPGALDAKPAQPVVKDPIPSVVPESPTQEAPVARPQEPQQQQQQQQQQAMATQPQPAPAASQPKAEDKPAGQADKPQGNKPSAAPVNQPTAVDKPASVPEQKPAAAVPKPLEQPSAAPVQQPPAAASKPVEQPAAAGKPATAPEQKPAANAPKPLQNKPVQQPAAVPEQKPAADAPKPVQQPTAVPEHKPAAVAPKPLEQPSTAPVQKPAADALKPLEQPAAVQKPAADAPKPVEQPAAVPEQKPPVVAAPKAGTPATAPEQKPVAAPKHKPAADLLKPLEQPALVQKPAAVPEQKPAAAAQPKPAGKPAGVPKQKPAAVARKPVEQPAPKADMPAAAPVQQPPALKPADKPAVTPVQKPAAAAPEPAPRADKPTAVPVQKPAAAAPKPADKPAAKPTDKPAAVVPQHKPAQQKPAAAQPKPAPVAQKPLPKSPAAKTQSPITQLEPIRLFLLATFANGIKPPQNGVKLIADAILTKHVDCIQDAAVAVSARPFGSHYRARPKAKDHTSGAPAPPPVSDDYGDGVLLPMIQSLLKREQRVAGQRPIALKLNVPYHEAQVHQQQQSEPAGNNTAMSVPPEAVDLAKDPPAAAMCRGSFGFIPGLYSLLAASVEGADWATWSCLAYKTSTRDERGYANVTAVEMYSPGAVELVPGFTYTCIAYYPKANAAAIAAAKATDWDSSISNAVQNAVKTAAAAPCTPLAFQPPLRGVPPPPIDIQGNKLVAAGKPLTIHGLNWFGFNVPMGVVDGLWAGGTDLATDFGKIAYQLKLLGYNAVRLPYTHRNLFNTQVSDVVRECASTNEDQLKQRVTDPQIWSVAANKELPHNVSPMFNRQAGNCNTYLPGASNMDRFLFVIQQFIAQGMYVVLDYQPMGTENQAYDLNQFASQWALVWKKVTCLPNFGADIAGRVFVDVMNEPDSMGIRWKANNDRPGAQQLYLATADTLWQMNPNQVMFMFEGTGQNMMGLSWGNGFVTDRNVIQSRGLSDANGFFQRLVTRPYAKKASIISPHVYPPSITGATFLGNDLWEQSRTAFGYLQNPGFCGSPMLQTQANNEVTLGSDDSTAVTMDADASPAGMGAVFAVTAKRLRKLLQGFGITADAGSAADAVNATAPVDAVKAPAPPTKPAGCTVFPVVIGETGSNFASATDRQWLNDFADYIMARGPASAYISQPLAGWLWWAYNENSMDTGGIVMNQWQDINWEKIRYMTDKLGLQAWHVNAPALRPLPPGPKPTPPTTPPPTKQPVTPVPSTPKPTPPVPQPPRTPAPQPTPPTLKPTPPAPVPPTPTPPPPAKQPGPTPPVQPAPAPPVQPTPAPPVQPAPAPPVQPTPAPPVQPPPVPTPPAPRQPEPQPTPPAPRQPDPQPAPPFFPPAVPPPFAGRPIRRPRPPRFNPRPPRNGNPWSGQLRPPTGDAFRPDLDMPQDFNPPSLRDSQRPSTDDTTGRNHNRFTPRDDTDSDDFNPPSQRRSNWRPPSSEDADRDHTSRPTPRRPVRNDPDDEDTAPIRRGSRDRGDSRSGSSRPGLGDNWTPRRTRPPMRRGALDPIDPLDANMVQQKDKLHTAYGGSKDYDEHWSEHKGRDDEKHDNHDEPQERKSDKKGPSNPYKPSKDKRKEGFKVPDHRDPNHKGPLLDGPGFKSPEHKPKGSNKNHDYWYGDEDADSDRGRKHTRDSGDDDGDDDKPRRKYKSLDEVDNTPAAQKLTPPSPASKDSSKDSASKDGSGSADKKEGSSTDGNQEGCIKLEDIPATKGGYKFVPPSQRKNLCKPATPDTKDTTGGKDGKKFEPLPDDDNKSDTAEDDRNDDRKRDEADDLGEDVEWDKHDKRDDRRGDSKKDSKKKKGPENKPPRKQETEEEEEEEDDWEDYPHPWPIIRDDNIEFLVPDKVKDNFWYKANKDGFMYMQKWDPKLAKYYAPKKDRAGNNALQLVKKYYTEEDIEKFKEADQVLLKKVAKSGAKFGDNKPTGSSSSGSSTLSGSSSTSKKVVEALMPVTAPVKQIKPGRSSSSSSSSSGGSGGSSTPKDRTTSSGSSSSNSSPSPSAASRQKPESQSQAKQSVPSRPPHYKADSGLQLPSHLNPGLDGNAVPKFDFYGNPIKVKLVTSGTKSSSSSSSSSTTTTTKASPLSTTAKYGPAFLSSGSQQAAVQAQALGTVVSKPVPATTQAKPKAKALGNSQQAEVLYWAYNSQGGLVPVYAQAHAVRAGGVATAGRALPDIADSYEAVDDSAAVSEAEAAAAATAAIASTSAAAAAAGAYDESDLGDDYEGVPVAIAAVSAADAADAVSAAGSVNGADAVVAAGLTAAASGGDAFVSIAAVDDAALPAATDAAAADAVAAAATAAAGDEKGEKVVTISAIEVGARQQQ